MYNEKFKEEFLENLDSENYLASYRALFNKTEDYEKEVNKDLYNFNMQELGNFYFAMATRSLHSLRVTNFLIVKYADYAISKGMRQSNINIFKLITLEQLEKYSAVYKNQYLTLSDFNEFMNYIVNDIDVAIFRSLFEGIKGSNFSELRNLKTADIFQDADERYYVNLTDELPDGTTSNRTIVISDALKNDLMRSSKQQEYLPANGMGTKHKSTQIVESPFVFRPVMLGAYLKSNGQINMQTIYRKKDMLNEVTDGQIKRVNSLIVSGMVHMAKELHDRKGSLSDEDCIAIGERFNNNIITIYDTQKAKHIRGVVREGLKELHGIII